MESWLPIVALIVFAITGNLVFWYFHSRWNRPLYAIMLSNWASKQDFEIVQTNESVFRHAPCFEWRRSIIQMDVRIQIRDKKGWTRKGWVRLGHWLYGPKVEKVEVIWDPAPHLDWENEHGHDGGSKQ